MCNKTLKAKKHEFLTFKIPTAHQIRTKSDTKIVFTVFVSILSIENQPKLKYKH